MFELLGIRLYDFTDESGTQRKGYTLFVKDYESPCMPAGFEATKLSCNYDVMTEFLNGRNAEVFIGKRVNFVFNRKSKITNIVEVK